MSHNNNAHVQSALIRDECAFYREKDDIQPADKKVCHQVVHQSTYARNHEDTVQKLREQYPGEYDQHRAAREGANGGGLIENKYENKHGRK